MVFSSTLGKRSRSSVETSGTSPNHARVKRSRGQVRVLMNDENENPFITHHNKGARVTAEDFDCIESDGDDDDAEDQEASTPTKIYSAARVPLSPTKINAQYKTTKPISASELDSNQRKTTTQQVVTPQTPRHRDALSKKVPITPRHRLLVSTAGKLPSTPRTPRTPCTPSNSIPTVYNAARQLFVRSAHPGRLVGRDDERAELTRFLRDRIKKRTGGCLYVSGPPGTGKSALVNEVLFAELDGREDGCVKMTQINCMSIRNAKDIFGRLIEGFSDEYEGGDEIAILKKMFVSRKRAAETGNVYLVALDEIDHLLALDLELVYKLFEWSLQKTSQLVLIGIANALDFTDRFLPRLKARHLKPQLLPFQPYAAPQITSVISNRLRSLLPPDTTAPADFVPFIHPAATQLCARKVASQTGDLRKAFDICRRAIEVVESETTQKHQQEIMMNQQHECSPPSPSRGSRAPLMENMNLSSSPASTPPKATTNPKQALLASLSHLTAETAPRATIAHIARISSAAFGNGVPQRLATLNLQQKAALCALVALEKRRRRRRAAALLTSSSTPSKTDRGAPAIRALFETYAALCKRDGMLHPLTATEFRDVVGSLETLGLVCAAAEGKMMGTPSKRGRNAVGFAAVRWGDERRVASCVGERELEAAVVDGGGGGGGGGGAGIILRGLLCGGEEDV
ncbi:MAG: AAA ATPase [Peltula sp. TS41687]|nr:MAG: AAA ATPase [Peltula sp. TS41687]